VAASSFLLYNKSYDDLLGGERKKLNLNLGSYNGEVIKHKNELNSFYCGMHTEWNKTLI
jgi:hypothetical protein